MIERHGGSWFIQSLTKHLQADPALPFQLHEYGATNLPDGKVRASIGLEGKQTRVPRPRHPGLRPFDMERMVAAQRGVQSLGISDLHVEDLPRVHLLDQPVQRALQGLLGVPGLARHGGRVAPDSPRDVERVQAQPEIGKVDPLHDVPRAFPRVDVRPPAETFIREPDRGRLLQPEAGHEGQVRRNAVDVPRRSLGLEIGRNLNQVRVEDVADVEPEHQRLDLPSGRLWVDEAVVEGERLQHQDDEAFRVAGGPHFPRSFQQRLSRRRSRSVAFLACQLVQALEKDLDASESGETGVA